MPRIKPAAADTWRLARRSGGLTSCDTAIGAAVADSSALLSKLMVGKVQRRCVAMQAQTFWGRCGGAAASSVAALAAAARHSEGEYWWPPATCLRITRQHACSLRFPPRSCGTSSSCMPLGCPTEAAGGSHPRLSPAVYRLHKYGCIGVQHAQTVHGQCTPSATARLHFLSEHWWLLAHQASTRPQLALDVGFLDVYNHLPTHVQHLG